jgi:hypothetical protein
MIARPGGFCFYVGRPFVGAGDEAGKMPALQITKRGVMLGFHRSIR